MPFLKFKRNYLNNLQISFLIRVFLSNTVHGALITELFHLLTGPYSHILISSGSPVYTNIMPALFQIGVNCLKGQINFRIYWQHKWNKRSQIHNFLFWEIKTSQAANHDDHRALHDFYFHALICFLCMNFSGGFQQWRFCYTGISDKISSPIFFYR